MQFDLAIKSSFIKYRCVGAASMRRGRFACEQKLRLGSGLRRPGHWEISEVLVGLGELPFGRWG